MYCLLEPVFSLLPLPLTEPFGAVEAKIFGFTCSKWLYEKKRKERENWLQ
jgi:hypothetical protein